MQNRHMFHGQEDKRECKHTGKYSRGEGSMMEVGVGAEAESVKGARKEGAQGGQRSGGGGEWDGHQSLGGRLAGRRRNLMMITVYSSEEVEPASRSPLVSLIYVSKLSVPIH